MHRIVACLPRSLSQRLPPSRGPRFLCVPHTKPPALLQGRRFVNSPVLHKKKDKAKNTPASDPDPSPDAASEDPFDHSQLQTGIATAVSRLKDDLSKLRAGGRFNTASLESLRVQLSKDSHDSVKLGDLAQVVPKGGRMVTILVAEEDVSWLLPFRYNAFDAF